MQLLNIAMLVTEHAARAVHALLGVVEGPAVLALELVVIDASGSLGEFLLSMCEATLALISALGSLDPVFAQLGLVFTICIDQDYRTLTRVVLLRVVAFCVLVGVVSLVGSSNEVGLEWLGLHSECLKVCGLEGGC